MLKNHMSTCKKTHVNMQHLFLMHPACAKRAAYPDPPPVILLPESIAAQAVYQLRYKSTEYCSWVSSGPKCFQVLGLSPSLLQNPML